MLLSMTGFGDARVQGERLHVAVEIRAVNNRYLKISTRLPERFSALEGDVERTIRQRITRGTINVSIRVDRTRKGAGYEIDREVVQDYWQQMQAAAAALGDSVSVRFGELLTLPEVVREVSDSNVDPRSDWPTIQDALEQSITRLLEFRQVEGESMAGDLQAQHTIITGQLDQVEALAPGVVVEFRDRLHARVQELLADSEGTLEDGSLIREVSIFSERCDINEEITRLRSHLEQFETFLNQEESAGRKMEFLTQEIYREVNTIGSKANNVPIAHCVVEMKAAVEKVREILQNVE